MAKPFDFGGVNLTGGGDSAGARPTEDTPFCIAILGDFSGRANRGICDAKTIGKRRAVLVRFDAGAKLPLHRHVGDELIFVIEGSNADESGEVMTGDMNFRPNGCVHSVTTRNGATVLALVTGGVEMMG